MLTLDELWQLAGPVALVAAWIVAGHFYGRSKFARHNAILAAQRDQLARWVCPHCQQAYGPSEKRFCLADVWNPRPRLSPTIEDPFVMDVIIFCPHCEYLQKFNRHGEPYLAIGVSKEQQRKWQEEEVEG